MQALKKSFIREILGLLSFAFAAFWFVAIASYDKDLQTGLVGPTGAFIASISFQAFGLLSYIGPLTLLLLAHWLIFQIAFKFQYAGLLLTILGLWPILATFAKGGMLGEAFKNLLLEIVFNTGLWLISITLTILGVMLMIGQPIIARLFIFLKNLVANTKRFIGIKKKSSVENSSKIAIIEQPQPSLPKPKKEEKAVKDQKNYHLPPLKLLDYDAPLKRTKDQAHMMGEAEKLQKAFLQFDISGRIREIRPGPVVTSYEFVPDPGIKLSKIAALSDDIAMAMSAVQVRIVTPIPGVGAVGIEVPNPKRETVYLKEIVADEAYQSMSHKLCMAVGKDVEGRAVFMNLADMPHVLIAGTTGSGKSVSMNAMICSILFRATPDEVKFLMIDPKMLEFSVYHGIPHLLLPPIIDPKKAANALAWAVKEMESRYCLMKEMQVRDIDVYNQEVATKDISLLPLVNNRKHQHLPYIVIVIDEYADLLAVSGKEVEHYVMRLAQKARACGIHVMLATQRPSVDVITGVIKANFPVRMGFRLASVHDSKTIINKTGAEKLLGRGDALIIPPGTSEVSRVHGCFISEKEISRLVSFWREQVKANYDDAIADFVSDSVENPNEKNSSDISDQKLEEAKAIVKEFNKCSTSFLQRKLQVGYNRAARLVEEMERQGLVGPVQNAKGDREIFLSKNIV